MYTAEISELFLYFELNIKKRRNRSASDSIVHRKLFHNNDEKIEIVVEIQNLIHTSSSSSTTSSSSSTSLSSLSSNIYLFNIYENSAEDDKTWLLHSTSQLEFRRSNHNSLNTSFIVDYFFERVQLIKIEIRDCSINTIAKNKIGNVIGSSIFKLDELIGAFGTQLQLPLSTKTSMITSTIGQFQAISQGLYCGWILVSARLPEKSAPVILQFAGKNLEKKEKFFDETSVFFVIQKVENDERKKEIYRSEVIREHSHPIWRPFHLHLRKIADHRNRLLEISVMYRDEMNKTGLIGSFLTTYAKMKYGPGEENIYNLINPKKKSKKGYLKSGTMELIKFSDVSFYSFLDYITGGTQLHLAIAVDFSRNLNINKLNDTQIFDNDFKCAIKGIAGIIRDYNSSKMFPAFGLGAKIPPTFNNSQIFHLNFDTEPYCRGTDGVLDAYRNAKQKVIPNDHAEYLAVINAVAKMAKNAGRHGLHYFILIIFLSNSSINNSKKLMNAIMDVTKAPISIIFLASRMIEFDGLYNITNAKKNNIHRDGGITTNSDFIEFIDLNSVIVEDATCKQNARRIAERVLRNVPWHLITYMHKNNIAAKPPIHINNSSVFHSSYLIPNQPSRYDEQLYHDKRQQNHLKIITPYISKSMFRSQSVLDSIDEGMNLSSNHHLSEYSSQRRIKPVLRRQLAIS
ncbi:Copine family protein [Dirofilaria immitis]